MYIIRLFHTHTMSISIKGIDKVVLLEELWNNAKTAGFFEMNDIPCLPFETKLAHNAIQNGYINYFCGRMIKADISGDVMKTYLYERDSKKTVKAIITNLIGTGGEESVTDLKNIEIEKLQEDVINAERVLRITQECTIGHPAAKSWIQPKLKAWRTATQALKNAIDASNK